MTKIVNKFKVFHRYEADLWGFLVLKRKKYNINKIIYLSQIDQFKKIDLRYLEILSKAPRGRRSFFRTLVGKANNLSLYLRRYFVNLSQRHLRLLVLRSKRLESLHKRNLSFLIESRLDAILLRSNLFTSVRTIRQWISHGFVFVNLRKVTCSNYYLKLGDIVSFAIDKKLLLFNNFCTLFFRNKRKYFNSNKYLTYWQLREEKKKFWLKNGIPLYRPKYLELNYKLFFFSLWKRPTLKDIPFLRKFKSYHITGPSKNRMRFNS